MGRSDVYILSEQVGDVLWADLMVQVVLIAETIRDQYALIMFIPRHSHIYTKIYGRISTPNLL